MLRLFELPQPYRAWARQSSPITACGLDSIRTNAAGSLAISGWGVIEAAAGVVPESFVLQLDRDGIMSYVANPVCRLQGYLRKIG